VLLLPDAEGLPPNTEFDFFVIQVPNAPITAEMGVTARNHIVEWPGFPKF
jgi:hypothetical protein